VQTLVKTAELKQFDIEETHLFAEQHEARVGTSVTTRPAP